MHSLEPTSSLLLHLSLIPHVGPLAIKRTMDMLERNGLSSLWLYRATVSDLEERGIACAQAEHIVAGLRDMKLFEEEMQLIEKYNVQVLFQNDSAYPSWLRAIHAPPPVLYVQGSLEVLRQQRLMSVVGSRAGNNYGRSVVEEFLPAAVACEWGIVSGGARGIDAHAHRITLDYGGKTVAVLGSGLLKPYPPEHRSLFAEIAASGGAVVSPFPLRMSALPGNFPARNRIIAGMCKSCLVVQAAEKSGALITAAYALDEGRDVGVVPGSIFDPLSAGCHQLLRDGATPIASRNEFMSFLGLKAQQVAAQQVIETVPRKISSPVVPAPQRSDNPLLIACRSTARHFDELLPHAGGCPDELYRCLWELQLEGKITQTVTGLWQKVAS